MFRESEYSCGANEKKMANKLQKKPTAPIVIYKKPPNIILDPSFVEKYQAENEKKVDSSPKEPTNDANDNQDSDSVVFVNEGPASPTDLKIFQLKKKIAALKREKRILVSQIKPNTITIDDDYDDGYDADNDETVPSTESQNVLNTIE